MASNSPEVSVLMPVFNCAPHVKQAVESILSQTFRDFELVIVDDGSSDNTYDIAREIKDTRIVLLRNPRNYGLIRTLNEGLARASGPFVARMDGDDIARPDRLSTQLAYMRSHPDVGILGTAITYFGEMQTPFQTQPPEDHYGIVAHMMFANCIAHPTAMFNREILRAHRLEYDTRVDYAQDYDLWVRAARYVRLANVPEVLLDYRVHPTQISRAKKNSQTAQADLIRGRLLQDLGIPFDYLQLRLHNKLANSEGDHSAQFVRDAHRWLRHIARNTPRNESRLREAVELQLDRARRNLPRDPRTPLQKLLERVWMR